MSKALTDHDIQNAAAVLAVPVPAIKAILSVESRGNGFLKDGRPVILFERHVMRRRLKAKGIETARLEAEQPNVVSAIAGGYQGGTLEHDRLGQAAKIDRDCALESASWGLFQIMGYHWKALGYDTLQQFINAMYRSEGDQLDAFVRFVKADPSLWKALKRLDWEEVARRYNGPAYAKNQYDKKLADAFRKAGGGIA